MDKWGLALISVGFLFIAISPTTGNQSTMIFNGVAALIAGGFVVFKSRRNKK